MSNQFVRAAYRSHGRYVCRLSHPTLCAVISISGLGALRRAESLIGFRSAGSPPNFPRDAA